MYIYYTKFVYSFSHILFINFDKFLLSPHHCATILSAYDSFFSQIKCVICHEDFNFKVFNY